MTLAGESRLFSYSDHLQGFSFDCRIRVSPIVIDSVRVRTFGCVAVDVRRAPARFAGVVSDRVIAVQV